MREKDIDLILEKLGREVQEKQFEQNCPEHNFSEEYKQRKLNLLSSFNNKKHHKRRGLVSAAAAFLAVVCLSATVYAATKIISVIVTPNQAGDSVDINVQGNENREFLPIEITPNYLPEGYAEWMETKYSPNGEYGADGFTCFDAGYYNNYTVPDVSDYEELTLGDAKAVFMYSAGYDYPWKIYLFYEDTGRVIEVLACENLSKEEMVKICENITYTEVEGAGTYVAAEFSYGGPIAGDYTSQLLKVNGSLITNIGEQIPAYGNKENGVVYDDEIDDNGRSVDNGIRYFVKSIDINEKVNTNLLNTDTTFDYERVMEHIAEDGTLVPFTRTVSEWTGQELQDREIGTVNMVNVEVTVEVENPTDTDYHDIEMQPRITYLQSDGSGNYVDVSRVVPGYEAGENFRGTYTYEISFDTSYFFDGSANPGSTHFDFMEINAGEIKEVHLWFAVPEDQLDQAYLEFNSFMMGDQFYNRYVKVTP